MVLKRKLHCVSRCWTWRWVVRSSRYLTGPSPTSWVSTSHKNVGFSTASFLYFSIASLVKQHRATTTHAYRIFPIVGCLPWLLPSSIELLELEGKSSQAGVELSSTCLAFKPSTSRALNKSNSNSLTSLNFFYSPKSHYKVAWFILRELSASKMRRESHHNKINLVW
jgi:hypothetical protein